MSNNAPQKRDRRVRRTRRLLRDALMALIVERGFDAITVQDITDRADVARSTFYLHFRDKEELLTTSMAEAYEELLKTIDPGDMASTADFDHVAENAAFYRTMLSEQGSMAFMVDLRRLLERIMRLHVVDVLAPEDQETRLPRSLIAACLAGMQAGLMTWWLENDMQPPAASIANMGKNLALQGVPWAVSQPEAKEPDV